jgi:hypothetical protein
LFLALLAANGFDMNNTLLIYVNTEIQLCSNPNLAIASTREEEGLTDL